MTILNQRKQLECFIEGLFDKRSNSTRVCLYTIKGFIQL